MCVLGHSDNGKLKASCVCSPTMDLGKDGKSCTETLQ